jgi:riboflavin biosynthesis pyrimidine reductase
MKRWKRESINKRKDGSTFSVQLMSDIVTDEDKVPLYIVTTCEDISGRKKMENEIKTRVAELEKFYRMSVGREVKMKELKKEIKRLKSRSGDSKGSQ